ncbi:hypothetical protein B0I73DRAFT_132741 [Yarrowia lipolytica]|uniref:Uncharacterized protein n=1 Tax=Yarrowia lipolytica TaxID=4952 RepID=A0A371CBH9_YARLL|nr:hypothetical protein B0I71DRAFT_129025 [Yarrowia lipolytica]RDW39018.1 hypothetical protein B0I73DRAFT_132741 [Yarrowia lipolytica]
MDNATMTSYRSAIDHNHYGQPETIPLGVLQPSSNRLNCKTAESVYKTKPQLNSAPIYQPSLTSTRWDGSAVMTTAQKMTSPQYVTYGDGVDPVDLSTNFTSMDNDPGPTSICMVKPSDLRQTSVSKSIMEQYRSQIRREKEAVEEQDYSTIRSVTFHPVEDLRIYEPLTGEHSENTFFPSPGSGSKVPRRLENGAARMEQQGSHLENSLFLSKMYRSPTPLESYSPVHMLEYGGSIHLGDSGWGPYGNKKSYTMKSTASMPRYMKDTISYRNKKRSKHDTQNGTEKGTRKGQDRDSAKGVGRKAKRDLLDFFRR